TVDQIPWPQGGRPYPSELECMESFKGVEIRFRPIKPSDERLLREFFYSHSAETVYQRYHAAVKSLSPQQIQRLCTLDYDREMALIGIVPEGEAEKIVAVGRYIVDPSTTSFPATCGCSTCSIAAAFPSSPSWRRGNMPSRSVFPRAGWNPRRGH